MIAMIIFIMIGMVIEHFTMRLTGCSLVNATIKFDWRSKIEKFWKGGGK